MKEFRPPSSAPLPAPALHKLEAATGLAMTVLVWAALGAAIGIAFAALLRRRNLAWSWGLVGLVPSALGAALVAGGLVGLREVAGWLAFGLGAASANLAWGIKGQIEDRRAGGDREVAAAERRRLLDPSRHRFGERGQRIERALAEGLPIGRSQRGELAMVGRGDARSGHHVLIPGATGAGKTTSLGALLVDYVARSGFGAVVLEAKTDRALLAAAAGAASARGVRLNLFSPSGPSSYDPLAHGSVDERSERLIAVESWGSADAGFYRQAASPFLRLVLRALDAAEQPATLASVAQHCEPDELENLALAAGEQAIVADVGTMIAGLHGDQTRAVSGLRARLQNLASSDLARAWLKPADGVDCFDLRGAIARREVAYFRFDTDRTGNVGRAIAQMVLLDLGAAASASMGRGVGTFVAIDEFGALEAPALERLFARGRAAGFSVAVGTQTLADLRAAGPAVRERIGATVSGIVCHRIGEQADAEWVAQLIGAVPTWQSTIRTDRFGRATSDGTRTRGYRFEVNPSQLQRLAAGEAYVAQLDRDGPRRSTRVRVVPPWERLAALGDRG